MEKTKTYNFTDNIEEIVKLEAIVDSIGEELGANDKLKFSVNLVLEELLSNTIFYGFKVKDVSNIITVSISKQSNELIIVVKDNAIAFNILEQEQKDMTGKSVEQQKVGGLGIHFVKKLTTFIKYKRINEFNYLTLSFNFNE